MVLTSGDDVAQAYASTSTNTVSGPTLLVKLYERLSLDLHVARSALERLEVSESHEALTHAQRIVRVLRMSLRAEMFRGGEELMMLYGALEQQLVRANLEKSLEPIAICEAIVEPLLEAWRTATCRAAAELGDVTLSVG